MRTSKIVVAAIALIIFITANQQAFAGGYWRFFISVDGKPSFTGGTGVNGEYSPIDHLESSVRYGRVQLGTESYLDEKTSGDITLTGDIVFRDQEHPPLHMKNLRLIYDPSMLDRQAGTTVAGGYYDWRLHPDDAAFIIAHYRKQDESANQPPMMLRLGVILTLALGVTLFGTTLLLFVGMFWLKRKSSSQPVLAVPNKA